jgi:sulfur-oxidizing protein SoxY
MSEVTRRDILQYAAGGAVMLAVRPAAATPAAMQDAIRKVVGNAKVTPGRMQLSVPPLSENGNTVPCTVAVESPMTAQDHVKAIHVFNEKNPQPNVISIHLGPRAGKANVSTRIRLSETQTVTAIAQMSDGSFRSHSANVIVTQGACIEDTP